MANLSSEFPSIQLSAASLTSQPVTRQRHNQMLLALTEIFSMIEKREQEMVKTATALLWQARLSFPSARTTARSLGPANKVHYTAINTLVGLVKTINKILPAQHRVVTSASVHRNVTTSNSALNQMLLALEKIFLGIEQVEQEMSKAANASTTMQSLGEAHRAGVNAFVELEERIGVLYKFLKTSTCATTTVTSASENGNATTPNSAAMSIATPARILTESATVTSTSENTTSSQGHGANQ